jgi:hypothetical protein
VSGVVSARVRGGSDCGHRGIHGGRNWGGGIRTHGAGFLPTRLKVSLLRPLGHAPVPRAKQLRANPNDDARARTGLPSEFGGSSRIGPRTAQSPHLYAGQKRSPNPALTRMQAFRGRDRTRAPQGPSRRSRRSLTPRGVAARRRAFGRFRPASSSTRSSDPARREAERESAGGGSWRRRPRSGRSPPGGPLERLLLARGSSRRRACPPHGRTPRPVDHPRRSPCRRRVPDAGGRTPLRWPCAEASRLGPGLDASSLVT